MNTVDIEALYEAQLASWPLAKSNYEALAACRRATVEVDGIGLTVMFNPARIRSSAAAVDAASVARRPCFLCRANRPAEQMALDMGRYELLVNPYPIFDRHLTIAEKNHTPQAVAGRVTDMLRLAGALPGMTVFYNGPASGASAPDHAHFQAVPTAELPMWHSIEEGGRWPWGAVELFEGTDAEAVARQAEGAIWATSPGREPDMNLYVRTACRPDGSTAYQLIYLRRTAHRPANYGPASGEVLVSPASAEMAGVIVTPREADFDYCCDPRHVDAILSHCGGRGVPEKRLVRTLDVGITECARIDVDFNGSYRCLEDESLSEAATLRLEPSGDGRICCNGRMYDRLTFAPAAAVDSFRLHDVMIGIGFHWQQHEDQSFHGQLSVRARGEALQAVNRVDVETYLRSVVSSEMNATAPEEFLKAHAVISRSWVMAQVVPPAHLADHDMLDTADETVCWYDRDAHTDFDICADDHCQRYQGCTKASTPQVESALEATRGQVLAYDNQLCDARFSKCCGGVTELFSTCWQPVDLPYLQAVDDPFCGRASQEVLRTVLNDYDRVTTDYYRWRVEYTAAELADIVARRSGIDYGAIKRIEPLHRGPSGRIDRLRIAGTRRERIIGKELEIRRTFSETHLYSSAFDVEAHEYDADGIPSRWTFTGRGWGHGVGLCQIGAAVMAAEGYDYRRILSHYFPGARLITIY